MRYVQGELLVEFKDSLKTSSDRSQVLSRHNAFGVRTFKAGTSRWSQIKVNSKRIEEALEALKNDPDVKHVQPNYIYRILATPNDPRYSQLWGLKNTGQTIAGASYSTHNPGTANKDMNLEQAWNLITDCSSVPVAIIDSGINYSQQDLVGNLWNGGSTHPNHGYNFVDNNNDPKDLNGHGTHVAGTIAATGNNSIGSTGVCWRASLMALKVLDASGSGTTADIIRAIDFAISKNARVINMSLGTSESDTSLQNAIQAASDHGIVVVVAAGNDAVNNDTSSEATYPCKYNIPNLVCVAALDQAFSLASFSNFGSTSVHIGAPGTNILSTYAGSNATISSSFHNSGSTSLNWSTSGGGWAYGRRTLNDGTNRVTWDMLLNPSSFDLQTAKYSNNMDARVYKSFDLSGALSAELGFLALVDIDTGDSFGVAYKTSSGDPFSSGTILGEYEGTTGNSPEYFSYDISPCAQASCSIGFRLDSDSSGNAFGVGIYSFEITTLTATNTSYAISNGTSMATPHVTGLAAMLFAYHPAYTAEDVVKAIKEGGAIAPALSGNTTTGKAADAYNSLVYLPPVTGVTAVVY